ncbi:hypothetical protein NKH77_27670 [Streptomyces sp. M19]
MSHRTATTRHARKAAAAVLLAVTALGLTACQGGDNDASSSTSQSATHSSADNKSAGNKSSDSQGKNAEGANTEAGTPAVDGEKCTNQINYAGDPRSNAEINSIGADTGTCPEPQTDGAPEGIPAEDGLKCTDQINYAGDPRPNAEINSIGADTGYCPPVKHQ